MLKSLNRIKLLWIALLFIYMAHSLNTTEETDSSMVCKQCMEPFEVCNTVTQACQHKKIFPMQDSEFFGILLLIVAMAATNAGGIGGGGILMPIIIAMFKFAPTQAIPLSNGIIFSSSIVRYSMCYNSKHPLRKEKNQIDFDVVMLCLPTILLGTYVGIFVKRLLPDILTVILLTAFLIYMTMKTSSMGAHFYKLESISIKESLPRVVALESPQNKMSHNLDREDMSKIFDSSTLMDLLNLTNGNHEPIRCDDFKELELNDGVDNELFQPERGPYRLKSEDVNLNKILAEEASPFPTRKLSLIWLVIIMLCAVSILRPGSQGYSIAGVSKCSVADWGLTFTFIAFCLIVAYMSITQLHKDYVKKQEINYPFLSTDIKWNKETLVKFSLKSTMGGFLAATLGIGGGLIFNPLLLDAGLPAEVASSTGMYMVMYSSAAATFQFIVAGELSIPYFILMSIFSAIGTAVGLLQIKAIVKRTGRTSYLVIALAGVTAISAIVMPIFGTMRIIKESRNGHDVFAGGSLC